MFPMTLTLKTFIWLDPLVMIPVDSFTCSHYQRFVYTTNFLSVLHGGVIAHTGLPSVPRDQNGGRMRTDLRSNESHISQTSSSFSFFLDHHGKAETPESLLVGVFIFILTLGFGYAGKNVLCYECSNDSARTRTRGTRRRSRGKSIVNYEGEEVMGFVFHLFLDPPATPPLILVVLGGKIIYRYFKKQ